MEIGTILWREWVFLKHRFVRITVSQLITPLLYVLVFGFGLGASLSVEGQPYLYFLIPGILSMVTMRNSYTAISTRVSITRLHEKSFESFVYTPTRMPLLALGHILAGALRGMYAGVGVILIGFLAGAVLTLDLWLVVAMFVNSVVFSALGFIMAMVINSHYDLNNVNSMVITPMSFLCGTFFSLSSIPIFLQGLIELMPLTHTTRLLRGIALGDGVDYISLIMAILFAVALLLIAVVICYREIKD